MTNIEELREWAVRLLKLLDDPHPELITWRLALADCLARIKEYSS